MPTVTYEHRLRELLRFAGITSSGLVAVRAFQTAHGLSSDGIVGPDTAWTLQEPWARSNVLGWQEVPADIVPGYDGYNNLTLRADVAVRYLRVLEEVRRAGGVVTTAGGRRRLEAEVTAGRSSKSLHYAGLAFDLSTVTGMQDPEHDPYVLVQESDRFRVLARAPRGTPLSVEAVVWRSNATTLVPTRGVFVDFTSIARSYGFVPIRPRSEFYGGRYGSAEWWHFQCAGVLAPHLSQFGTELLRCGYTPEQLEAGGIWGNREAMWQDSWF